MPTQQPQFLVSPLFFFLSPISFNLLQSLQVNPFFFLFLQMQHLLGDDSVLKGADAINGAQKEGLRWML